MFTLYTLYLYHYIWQEETYIRGVHFSCNITYDDVNGYSVSCVGIIPELLVQQFRLITCRPSSVLLGDDDDVKALEEHVQLPDCDISNSKNVYSYYFF